MFKKLRKLDYWIAVPFAILSMLGIVMVFSATQGTTAALSNFIKQAIFVVIGLMAHFFYIILILENYKMQSGCVICNLVLLRH
jgi:cell division protein FtsW (lipid II flippase)